MDVNRFVTGSGIIYQYDGLQIFGFVAENR
jgi:hypothetical protein